MAVEDKNHKNLPEMAGGVVLQNINQDEVNDHSPNQNCIEPLDGESRVDGVVCVWWQLLKRLIPLNNVPTNGVLVPGQVSSLYIWTILTVCSVSCLLLLPVVHQVQKTEGGTKIQEN